MRNHLDERALHRAWTENRLAGACVSQQRKSIPAVTARQEPGEMRLAPLKRSFPARALRNVVEPIAPDRFVGPKIPGDGHRGGSPSERPPEPNPGAIFLQPREPDFKNTRLSWRIVTHRPI